MSEGSLEGQGPQSTWEREDKAEDQRVTRLRPLSRRAVSAPGRGGPGSHLGSGCQDPAPPPLSPGPPVSTAPGEEAEGRGEAEGKEDGQGHLRIPLGDQLHTPPPQPTVRDRGPCCGANRPVPPLLSLNHGWGAGGESASPLNSNRKSLQEPGLSCRVRCCTRTSARPAGGVSEAKETPPLTPQVSDGASHHQHPSAHLRWDGSWDCYIRGGQNSAAIFLLKPVALLGFLSRR